MEKASEPKPTEPQGGRRLLAPHSAAPYTKTR